MANGNRDPELVCAYRDVAVRDLAWLLMSPPLLDSQHFGERLAQTLATQGDQHRTLAWLASLDADPRALHTMLQSRPQSRLGLYAERLLGFFLERGPATRLIAANRPVRIGAHTLGECDFLFEDVHGHALHWELAVKCYLDVGGPADSLARYVGPNLADRFDHKLDRLLTHQLTLSRHPQIAALAPGGHWHAAMIVRGWLFHCCHSNGAERPGPACGLVAPDHARGWWTRAAQWPAFDAPAWTIVPRLRWMAPQHIAGDHPLVYRDPKAVLARCFEYWRHRPGQPLMVAALDDGDSSAGAGSPALSEAGANRVSHPGSRQLREFSRGFIVPEGWPERAVAFAHGTCVSRGHGRS